MFTLAISCLTTFTLPWFADLTLQAPMKYLPWFADLTLQAPMKYLPWFADLTLQAPMKCCSLQFWSWYFYHQSHLQLGIVFALAQPLQSFWIYFSTLPQLHFGHLLTRGVHLSASNLFAFSWGSQGKNTEVVCHSLLWWTAFSQNSPPSPVHLGWPYMAWLIVPLS